MSVDHLVDEFAGIGPGVLASVHSVSVDHLVDEFAGAEYERIYQPPQ